MHVTQPEQSKQTNSAELIILVGPPCSGKTAVCLQRYPAHERLFVGDCKGKQDRRRSSIHSFIQQIQVLLNSAAPVVVDDNNELERTRRSYLKVLSNISVKVKTKAVVSQVPGGMAQCQYQNEFNLARNRELMEATERKIIEDGQWGKYREPIMGTFEEWIDKWPCFSPPSVQEGFDEIEFISPPITVFSVPFFRACLFLDIRALLKIELEHPNYSQDDRPKLWITATPNAAAVIQEWHVRHRNSDARVVVVIDETAIFPSNIQTADVEDQVQLISDYRAQISSALIDLALSTPFYFICAEYGSFEPNSFFRLPQDGMIAWAQFRHKIDLQKSVFVVPDIVTGNSDVMQGLPFIEAAKLFEVTGWDVKSKIRRHSMKSSESLPSHVTNISFLSPKDIDVDDFCCYVPTVNEAPLLDAWLDKKQENEGDNEDDMDEDIRRILGHETHVILQEEGGRGRVHGCIVPIGWDTKHMTHSPVSKEGRTLDEDTELRERSLPSWMTDE
eukprot:TRINITY_DN9289_c0_g1_i1.p1 TRINITY_DN9289_c0_g1~~TRINITY_DN9289_c0_g1_i1.p1  ORF type:complete len:502 (-),score=69.82 TRINITY_DN9289_c0_g1_i1:35-1540(-)